MRRRVNTPSLFLIDPFRWLLWCITFASKDFDIKWDKVFKDGPSKFCGRKPLKKFKGHGLLRHTISLQIFQRFSSTNYTWSIHVRGHPSSNYAKVPEKLTVPIPWGGQGGARPPQRFLGFSFFIQTNDLIETYSLIRFAKTKVTLLIFVNNCVIRENVSFLLVEPCSRVTCCVEIKLQFLFVKYIFIC